MFLCARACRQSCQNSQNTKQHGKLRNYTQTSKSNSKGKASGAASKRRPSASKKKRVPRKKASLGLPKGAVIKVDTRAHRQTHARARKRIQRFVRTTQHTQTHAGARTQPRVFTWLPARGSMHTKTHTNMHTHMNIQKDTDDRKGGKKSSPVSEVAIISS